MMDTVDHSMNGDRRWCQINGFLNVSDAVDIDRHQQHGGYEFFKNLRPTSTDKGESKIYAGQHHGHHNARFPTPRGP